MPVHYKQQLTWWLAILALLLSRPAAAQLNFSWATTATSPSLLNQEVVTMDGTGNSYAAGVFVSSVTFGTVTKVGDGVYVAKYDASGNLVWVRRIACEGVWAIKADAAGTVWVAGTYHQTGMQPEGSATVLGINSSYSGWGTYLVQYSPQGNLVSTSLFLSSATDGDAFGPYLALDGQGGAFICYNDSRVVYGPALGPAFGKLVLAKVNAAGTVVQTRTDLVSALANTVIPYGLYFDATLGHLCVMGTLRTSVQAAGTLLTMQHEGDLFVANYTANLGDRWSRLLLATVPAGTRAGVITSIPNGLVVDGAGNVTLALSYVGTIQVPGGPLFSKPGPAKTALLVQLSTAGTYQWSRELLDCETGGASCLAVDATGTLYLAGNARQSLTFGNYQLVANPQPHPWYSSSANYGLIAALSPTGQPLWARQDTGQPTAGSARFAGVSCNLPGTAVTVSGNTYGATGFGNLSLPPAITSTNGNYNTQLFVARLDNAPATFSFLPLAGSVGQRVVLNGRSFQGTTAVSFNGIPATAFQVNATGDQVVAMVPAGATTGSIAYTTPSGTVASSKVFQVGGVLATQAAQVRQVSVYPNPTPHQSVRLQSSAGLTPAQVSVRDVLGRLIPVTVNTLTASELEIRGLPSGRYLLQLQTPAGLITRQLVVE
jgi:hypothetical protein